MSLNPEPLSLRRLEGRLVACEGILRSQLGRRPLAAGSRALQELQSSQWLAALPSRGLGSRTARHAPGLARRPAIGKPAASSRLWWLALAACFVILSSLCVYSLLRNDRVVARITEAGWRTVIRRGSKTFAATTGQCLRAGDRIGLGTGSRGLLKFQYCGEETAIEVYGRGDLRLGDSKGAKQVALNGHLLLQARVAHQPAGWPMVLTTRHAQAKVLGTRLQLSVRPNATSVEVMEGVVRLIGLQDGKTVDVARGYSARVAQGAELVSRPFELPDLIVTDITWSPAKPVAGQAVVFRATVKNQGTAPTPPGVIIGVKFNIDGQPKVAWSDDYTNGLSPDDSVTLVANNGPAGTNAWFARPGRHEIRATVNDIRRFAEINSFNNYRSQRFTVR